MSINLKEDILKAVREAKELDMALTGCKTPKFRKPTAPPPPSMPPVRTDCTHKTPCGWCTKWDKKCDRKIGCDTTPNTKAFGNHTRAELVAMEELLDKYHKFYGQEKFTEKEN
jgi:hypothetical protein